MRYTLYIHVNTSVPSNSQKFDDEDLALRTARRVFYLSPDADCITVYDHTEDEVLFSVVNGHDVGVNNDRKTL